VIIPMSNIRNLLRTFTWTRTVACLVASCAAAICWPMNGMAQYCPSSADTSNYRWSFEEAEFIYTGTAWSQTDVATGVESWDNVQTSVYLEPYYGAFTDIIIDDDDTVPDTLAVTQRYNYGNGAYGQSPCWNHPSTYCGNLCFGNSNLYYANIHFDPSNMAGSAYGWASIWGVSDPTAESYVVRMVAAHEAGHFMGLDDIESQSCSNPSYAQQYGTIMNVDDQFYCQMFFGASSCDGSSVPREFSDWNLYPNNPCNECNENLNCSN